MWLLSNVLKISFKLYIYNILDNQIYIAFVLTKIFNLLNIYDMK